MNFYTGGYGNTLNHYKNFNLSNTFNIPNASYLCKFNNYLYAVIEQQQGKAAAFFIESDGQLRLLNEIPTNGSAPCHLSVEGNNLYIAHYTSGTTTIIHINADGSLGQIQKTIDHNSFGSPSKAYPGRQEKPHAHYAQARSEGIWICDLGLDCVLLLNPEGQELKRYTVPSGDGPRHLAFHPTLNLPYVACEMGNTIISLEHGTRVSILWEPNPKSTCAAIRVSPCGGFLLISNRGEGSDSISILTLENGNIGQLIDVVSAGGRCPRDFVFDPEGKKVLVACQESNLIQTFDWQSGKLTPTGISIEVERPTCILFQD